AERGNPVPSLRNPDEPETRITRASHDAPRRAFRGRADTPFRPAYRVDDPARIRGAELRTAAHGPRQHLGAGRVDPREGRARTDPGPRDRSESLPDHLWRTPLPRRVAGRPGCDSGHRARR